ncbi:unnamed protein product [Agarophyton chilense]
MKAPASGHTALAQQCDAHVGTLCTSICSPISNAISAVAHISGRQLRKSSSSMPMVSHVLMWMRLGGTRTGAMNGAILQTNQTLRRHMYNSLDIARHIDSQRVRGRRSLFPAHLMCHITLFERHAHAIVRHMQMTLVHRLQHNMNAAQAVLLPPRWRHRFFSRVLVRMYLWWLNGEHGAHVRQSSREHARKALNAVRAALSCYSGTQLRYLCGQNVTFADVVVAESIYFDGERHDRLAQLFGDDEFSEAFPDVVAWGRAVRHTHYDAL